MLSRCPNFLFLLQLGLGKMIFSFSPYSQCAPTTLPIIQQWVLTRLPNMLLSFQHVFPNMFPMIPIYYLDHIGKWHPPLFLFPLYSQWVPKWISSFFVFPMCSQHPSYNNSSLSHTWSQMLPPFHILKWSESEVTSCASKFWGASIMQFFFLFNELIKLFHYNMNILSLVYTSSK